MNEKKDEFKEWVVSTFDKEAEQELRRLQEKEEKFEVPEGVKEAVFERLQEQLRERNERNASRQEVEEDGNIISRQHTEENDDNVNCRNAEEADDSINRQNAEKADDIINCQDAEEADDIISKLSPEDREALEIGRKMMKAEIGATANDCKKSRGRKRPLKIYMALAAVIICVLAMGITSIGGPERVVRMVRQVVGDRDVEQVDSSDENKIIEGEKEEEAYQKIEDTFDTDIVKITWKPNQMNFNYLEMDKSNQIAELYYDYNSVTVAYWVNMSYSENSWGVDIEDEVNREYEKKVNDCLITIKEYKMKSQKINKYTAKFRYKKQEYFLTGTMERKDFEKILENLFFPR